MKNLMNLIIAEADSLGFSFISFTHTRQTPHYPDFLDWINRGFSGEMQYLARESTIQSRRNPAELMKNASSMIVFGFHYPPLTSTLPNTTRSGHPGGWIASYACYQDYHSQLRDKAHLLMEHIRQQSGREIKYRVFVDSAPLMEKDTAFMAGAGWIGKNSLLLTTDHGSYVMIGCILTDLDLPSVQPAIQDQCGTCQQCIRACPTGCISENHNIDARRCIAYLTIEHKGIIPRELRSKMGNWIFGCDICQNVCPANKKVTKHSAASSSIFNKEIDPVVNLVKEIQINLKEFENKYTGTPVLRATLEGFQRNLIIAMGNSRSKSCIAPLENILLKEQAWTLRLHAAWALGEINTRESLQIIEQARGQEEDERVRAEILLCLSE